MTRELKRIHLKDGTDLSSAAEEVHADKEPRVLERDGKAVAALVSLEDLDRLLLAGPSKEGVIRALGAAGTWKDIDADELIERIYKARHESPPSPPISR